MLPLYPASQVTSFLKHSSLLTPHRISSSLLSGLPFISTSDIMATTTRTAPDASLMHSLFFLGKDEWTPLYLSTIAGLSTCLGAAVVFLHPRDTNTNQRAVSESTMSFSLALAGSVMVTVSVISIGPECLEDPLDAAVLMPLWSWVFAQRLASFLIGCLLYWALSYFAFPEPDDLLMETMGGEATSFKEPGHHDAVIGGASNNNSSHADERKANKAYMRRKVTSIGESEHGSAATHISDEEANMDEEQQRMLLAASTTETTENSINEYHKSDKTSSSSSTTVRSLSRWSSGADLDSAHQRRAWRVAMLLFVSLLCHNFPEGLAVAASALESANLGIAVTIGIMIHNIPEGIAIAVPCLAARPEYPWLAFLLASASGLAEPLGAFVALLFLRNVDKDVASSNLLNMENVLAFVAGIMIMVALYELFPEANRHTGESKRPLVAGTLCGIIVMATTEYCLP